MARILIAWELGEAFGHFARCLRLAQSLVTRGHSVALVLKEVLLPAGQRPGHGVTVLQAPLSTVTRRSRAPSLNYADVLRDCGYADAQDVAARLQAWQAVCDLWRPDALVADHAPTAMLAAHLKRIPHLAIGNGFAVPPSGHPWPTIRPWETVEEDRLWAAEEALNRVTANALQAMGLKSTVTVRALFGDLDILDTFPELDHYGVRVNGRYVGPIGSVPQTVRVNWQSQLAPKILAYLRPGVPGFAGLLKAMAEIDAEVVCVAPGLRPEIAKQCATRRLRIATAPIDLPPLLSTADLAIGYGNSGFSAQSLLAGVPLGMRPRHVEQALMARRVESLGAGLLLEGLIDTDHAALWLQGLLKTDSYRQAAKSFSDRYREFSPGLALEQAVQWIERALLGDGPPTTPELVQSIE